jgi:hypothetical protein
MKANILHVKRIRTELLWLLGGFIAALAFHVHAVLCDQTAWSALITSFHAVILLALVFYVLLLFIRGLVSLVMRFAARKRKP